MTDKVYSRKAFAREQEKRDEELSTPYPVKLLGSKKEQQESGRVVWILEMERQNAIYKETGELARRTRYMTLETAKGRLVWPGSDTDRCAESFEQQTGCDMLPDHPDLPNFIGHYFMVKDVPQAQTKAQREQGNRRFWMTLCVEYLGPEYEYTGEMDVVEPRDAGESQVAEEAAEERSNEEELAVLKEVAAHFNGMTAEELKTKGFAILNSDNLSEKTSGKLAGISIRGSITSGTLHEQLEERGIAKVENGKLVVG